MNTKFLTQRQILIRFSRRDPKAIEWVYNKSQIYVLSLVRKQMQESEDIEDLVCEILTALLEHKGRFNKYSNIKGFLFSTARNICLKHLNHLRIMRKNEADLEENYRSLFDQDFERSADYAEMRMLIERSIEKLPAKTKKIFKLFYHEGLSNSAIAQLLKIKEKTVANHKTRARELLRWELRAVKRIGVLLLNIFI